MKRNTSCKFVELLHPPCNVPGWQFFEQLSGPSPQKQVNIILFSILRHIRPSTHAPLNSVVDKTLTPSPWTTLMDYPNGLP